ncbi:peptidoglycan-binding protein [Frigidibacter albus]|uniref:Peptidoglycan-binding protein n=1 Tax=Frigidibacter albus TaxID=1465486 RepID=A0A6L8VLJ6_9RHOB|nr:peptidoglycan-binding domain-containing protein [Frigidibacter albus]MZQ90030.1 peptidoglycan-binding protein [Frigidibacter albus]NBE31938.1 peptidoglycan-binding protein [Frigidibacter albus]GGH57740.1 peptidoglycan-binding protein [Frigidibacter albus]
MIAKRIATTCLATALVMTPATRAAADAGDAILGAVVGGLIGGAIVNENNKKRNAARPQQVTRSSGQTSAQREANRETQVALNYFGFPVGTPDGSIGPKSRAAISEYQAVLGYPPTGQLTEYERTLLVGSYHRGIAGGGSTMQLAAQNPMGMRGLLVAWRDEAAGVPPVAAAVPAPFAPGGSVAAAVDAVAPAPAAPAMPSFLGGVAVQASLASQCNTVSLTTATNGGFVTAASMTDPGQALAEQFCLARTYAISEGEQMAAKVPGFTPAQIAEQCQGFGPAMKDQIAGLSLKPASAVLGDVQGFALGTGMAPAQLAATAKICLSVGYRTDNMEVAIASALLLTTLGEGAYAELLGHHLAQGFGAARRPDLALGWYDMGLGAVQGGATAVFAPGQPERTELIRRAANAVGGRADPLPTPVPAALPSFTVPVAPAPAPVIAPLPAPEDQSSLQPVAPAPAVPVMALAEPAGVTAASGSGLPGPMSLPFLLLGN